jgi:hypothetical protein
MYRPKVRKKTSLRISVLAGEAPLPPSSWRGAESPPSGGISICNAQLRHTGYKEGICRFFRITNANTLRCRIANSAGRKTVFAMQSVLID